MMIANDDERVATTLIEIIVCRNDLLVVFKLNYTQFTSAEDLHYKNLYQSRRIIDIASTQHLYS